MIYCRVFTNLTRKCFTAGRKKNGLPLSMFPFLGSLPQTTNLVVCICWGGGGGGVNYQMQIVTKLPNENIQNYQLQMINSGGGGGKLPNANCGQTTKLKYPKLPTTNDRFWGEGGKLPNANCDQTTKWYHRSGSEWLGTANFAQFATFQSFPTEVAQNDSEWPIQAKLLILSHFEPLQWEKIGKVVNQAKLAVQSPFEPLWWEKIRKLVNRAKLAVLSHSEPLWWYHMVVWSQFAFGSLPPWNQSFVVGSFGYFHLVVWSQFAFGSLSHPHPPTHPPPHHQTTTI